MKKFVTLIVFVFLSTILFSQINVTSAEMKDHVGQIVSICDRIVDAKFLENAITKPTLLNVGGAYPNHLFTIVINFENRGNFSFKPEEYYLSKRVCVTGKVVDFKGKPQIVVLSPAEMIINEDETQFPQRSTQSVANKPVASTQIISSVNTPLQKDTAASVKPALSTTSIPASNIVQKTATPPPAKINPVASAPLRLNNTINDTSSATKSTTTKAFDTYDIKLTADVNVRSGPANTSDVLEIIKSGTVVTILNSENGWSYVSYRRFSQEQLRPVLMKGYIKNSVLK